MSLFPGFVARGENTEDPDSGASGQEKKDNYCTEKETFPAGKNKLEGGQMGSDGLRQKGCPGAGISIQG